MKTFLPRTGLFALLFAVSVPLYMTPAQAQQEGRYPVARDTQYAAWDRVEPVRPGVYTMARPVREDGSDGTLRYRLVLRPDGDAALTVERVGSFNRSRYVDSNYGSILWAYLKDDNRVTHTGRWSTDSDGDRLTVRLDSIEGHRDNAVFTGTREDNRLILTTSNAGMYGRAVRFSLRRADEIAPRDRDRDGNRDRWNRDQDWDRGGRPMDAPVPDRDRDHDRRPGDWQGNDWDRGNRDRGTVTWQGNIDSGAILYIKQNSVRAETTNDKGIYNSRSNFDGTLPQHPTRLSLARVEGRGQVTILEQPTRQNGFTAAVKITDPDAGRGDYKLTLRWE